MTRLLGSALLLLGGLAMGLVPIWELSQRARVLALWSEALLALEGELSFGMPTMPQLLEELSRRLPPPVGTTLEAVRTGMDALGEEPFARIWDRALCAHSGLRGEELAPLRPLGEALARYERAERDRALEHARERLLRQETLCREAVRQKGRAYGVLGVTLGAFAVILLL